MNKTVSVLALCIGSVAAVDLVHGLPRQEYLPTRALAGAAPTCPYGLEPGGGAMRCANPNDPSSYLYKKAHAPKPAKAAGGGYTISPDGKEIITADGRHWARRPAWMPSPQQDPGFCARETHSASALNRCVQIQNQEFLPSEADYENALEQQSAFLYRVRRDNCITEHGTWVDGTCLHH